MIVHRVEICTDPKSKARYIQKQNNPGFQINICRNWNALIGPRNGPATIIIDEPKRIRKYLITNEVGRIRIMLFKNNTLPNFYTFKLLNGFDCPTVSMSRFCAKGIMGEYLDNLPRKGKEFTIRTFQKDNAMHYYGTERS